MVSGFRQKKIVSLERVGEILRRERLSQNKKLPEIAREIKVREENLHRLEESYYKDLPADVYTKGFIKSYAENLGLPASRLIRQYDKEQGVQEHIEREETDPRDISRPVKPPILTPRLIRIGGIVAVVAVAIVYLGVQLKGFSENPHLSLSEPTDNLTIEEDKIVFKGEATRQAELKINGEGVFVDEDGIFEKEIPLQEGINEIAVIVSDRQGRSSELKRQVMVEKPPEPPSEESKEEQDENSEAEEEEESNEEISLSDTTISKN